MKITIKMASMSTRGCMSLMTSATIATISAHRIPASRELIHDVKSSTCSKTNPRIKLHDLYYTNYSYPGEEEEEGAISTTGTS